MKKNKGKVVCAMSGGIDSSVAAAFLKEKNFYVIGIFMKFWSEPKKGGLVGGWNKCCSAEAEKRARKVATILGIPFYVLNLKREFKKRIVDYFLTEYRNGRTPNPCVACNKQIKFGLLLDKALALDADFVATGHYARKKEAKDRQGNIRYKLLRGKDKEKDQSYFLWQLNQKQLKHILLPLGDYKKKQVRDFANKFKLPVLQVPESMEVCFIQTTINDFLKKRLKEKNGKVVNRKEKIIGEHRGLWFYTIGQRKGIELPNGPYYVSDKDSKRNLLIVTKKEKDLYKEELKIKDVNWISGKKPKSAIKAKAKIRYRHLPASVIIDKKTNSKLYSLKFTRAQRAITPGQSVVFYRGEELLGGGIIL